MQSNRRKSIGVIGAGFVGKAVFKGFSLYCETKMFDINPSLSVNSFEETVSSDIVFVCVPTPMSEDGSADLSMVKQVLKRAEETNKNAIYVIKSTIPVGTIKSLSQTYELRIVHSPEFLTARTALIDFITPTRTIVGGYDMEAVKDVCDLFRERFPGHPVISMSGEEAEMVKYVANCFFATKITFFNEVKLLADKLGLDWDTVMSGVLADGRIAHSHTDVPGHDGKPGFGGACFPKDINALISTMKNNGINPIQLIATRDQNNIIRKSQP
jgi:UDPglucose 6-dehydrogenase